MAQSTGTRVPELTRSDDLPVGVNLAWRLQVLIQSGRLRANERLPGVRDLAEGAGLNVNTVRAVYRRLEGQGLVVSRQGQGTFVASHVTVTPALEQFAAQVAAEAIGRGIDPRELARALYSGSSAEDPFAGVPVEEDAVTPPTPRDERAARAALRGQIARLEASLAPYPETGAPAEAPRAGTGPRLADLEELEAIRDELVARLKRARADAERSGERQGAARRWREDAITDPSGHRGEWASSEDLGEEGCGRWEVGPAWGPVGSLMDWWRVKVSSGCP